MKDDRGELDMTKQIDDKDELIQELRMRIRDMLIISEQHRNILAEEIRRMEVQEHAIIGQPGMRLVLKTHSDKKLILDDKLMKNY